MGILCTDCAVSCSFLQNLSKQTCTFICKTYSYPITRLDSPFWLQEAEAARISRESAHEGGKVVSPTHRLSLPPRDTPGTHFCYRLSRPQGHSAAGRIKSIKNQNDPTGNQTGDLPAFGAVSPSTAPPRTLRY